MRKPRQFSEKQSYSHLNCNNIKPHCDALHSKRKTNKQELRKIFCSWSRSISPDESGVTHKHYFDFSIFDTKNGAEGSFNLVCVQDKQILMIIKSNEITSFSVESVKKGLQATFTGSATVKMDNDPWQEGWSFTITAFDSNTKAKDTIGITLYKPNGQLHCSMEPTPTASGDIAINK